MTSSSTKTETEKIIEDAAQKLAELFAALIDERSHKTKNLNNEK